MPPRPDLRDIASNVREAFADADRDTLLDVLTFVVKEYVVEGPPPMMIHQAETLSDLKGMSFAQLIAAMQTRFDHAELAMFVVDGEQVSVRVGGVVQPLLPSRQPIAEPPRQAPGVRVVETTLAQQRPAAPAPVAAVPAPRPAAPASAPSAHPPTRGLSLRGRPTGEGGDAPPLAAPPPAAAAPPPPDRPEGGGDDASARFSLLELD